MKFIWEYTDIKPENSASRTMLGTIIEYTKTTASNRFYILGYKWSGLLKLITVSSLDDGLIIAEYTIEDMISFLNKEGYAPVMEPARFTSNISADK